MNFYFILLKSSLNLLYQYYFNLIGAARITFLINFTRAPRKREYGSS